jgi:glycosyltransferase involved in cell wall biosynthesis
MDGAVIDGKLDPTSYATRPLSSPLKVGVLVDLTLSQDAGGHVKCWERIAEAATGYGDRLDLTVHFNGPALRRIELSPSVRYVLLPTVLSTKRLVRGVPDHTDLAPWHPRLARMLSDYDVIHTTDAFFCYAHTATRFSRRHGVPVVSSIHTNTPEYARITVEHLLGRWLGSGAAYRLASKGLDLPGLVSRRLQKRLQNHLGRVAMAMASYGDAPEDKAAGWHCGVSLRRGLDRALFSPARRDRAWLETRFGLPPGQFVAMYAGKLNTGKNVQLLAPAVTEARRRGLPVHLLCPGKGDLHDSLLEQLGGAVTLPGVLAQDELARALASADLFLFPSTIDESGNAAVEALAAGLPALLAGGSGVAVRMADCLAVRVLPGDDATAWAAAIAALAADPRHCRELGTMARAYIETEVPSWEEVVIEDLLPVWREAAASRRANGHRH